MIVFCLVVVVVFFFPGKNCSRVKHVDLQNLIKIDACSSLWGLTATKHVGHTSLSVSCTNKRNLMLGQIWPTDRMKLTEPSQHQKKLELNPKSNKTLKASRLLTSESGFTFPKKTDENQKTQPWALLTPKKNEFGPKIPFFGRRSRSFLLQALLSQSRCCCTQPRGWKNLHPRCFRVLGADLGTFFGVGGVGLGTWPLSHKNLLGLGTWGFRVVL